MNKHFFNILFLFCVVALFHTAYGLFYVVQGREYCILEPNVLIRITEFVLVGSAFLVSCVVAYYVLFKKGYYLGLERICV